MVSGGGFIDISAALASGVYLLEHRGRVVYVGKAKGMIDMITGHRRLARKPGQPWNPVPGIVFDRALVQPCHPDRVDALLAALIAEYQPIYNRAADVVPITQTTIRRRI